MVQVKRKRGGGTRAARARRMPRGQPSTSFKKRFTGQYASREQERAEKAEEKRDIERLKENARAEHLNQKLAEEPHTMVFHRGKVGKYLRKLEQDLRKVMEPNTASKLKVLKRNNLKDFIVNGAPLGVTHLIVITRTEQSVTLRVIRAPQGPTLTFRVASYTLAKDVVSALKRPMHFEQQYIQAPLVIMSGLGDTENKHLKLVQSLFQSMFPAINVDTIKLSTLRRCFMINYNAEAETFELRHYGIKAVPSGLSKSAKKLVQSKVPDLSRYSDISDYFLKPEQLSESEFEGDEKEVELPQDLKTRGCKQGQTTNIRLVELGPRITLSLLKIEEGIDDGEVLYHSYITKTAKELARLRENLPKKRKLKERRVKENEQRVIRRLKKIADRNQEREELEKREKERLINKQKAVTGQYDNEEESSAKPEPPGKRKTDEDDEEAKRDEPANKYKKFEEERKNRQSDGLTRAERRKKRTEEAEALRNKTLSKRKPRSKL